MSKINISEIKKDPYEYSLSVSISELEKIIRELSFYYYNKKALVSDEVFDILVDVMKKRDPNNVILKEVGAPISKDKVKLPYPLGSLSKIKPDTNELEKWMEKYPGKKVLSDKLDGTSALIVITKDGYEMYSRGDGFNGQNISHLITYVLSDKVFESKIPIGTAIRGELIISKDNFEKIKKSNHRTKKEYSNPRNTVAGLVNSKRYSIEVAKATDFVAYTITNPRYKYDQQMKLLEKYGFIVVNHKITKNISNDKLSKMLIDRRKNGLYEVDGIVVCDSEELYKHRSGNPDHCFAFKQILTDQVAEVKVLKVEWNVSKDNYMKPIVHVEEVVLQGVTITKATGHNALFISENIIGPGAVIKIIRSGDVIPYIKEVLKPAENKKPQMPKTKYKWNDSKVDIISIDPKLNNNVKIKLLKYFFSELGVKYISEGIIKKLVENGIDDIFKFIDVNKDELSEIDGIGDKLIDKIYDSFDKAIKESSLHELMSATNIFGRNLGKRKLKLIIDEYPDILKKKNISVDEIKRIEGFDDILAKQFVSCFTNFIEFYKKLKTKINLDHLTETNKYKSDKDTKLMGLKIVFTGFRNKEWEKHVEREGGKITSSVSKNTDILVYTDESSSKYKKALKLIDDGYKIKLMTPDKFEKYMK